MIVNGYKIEPKADLLDADLMGVDIWGRDLRGADLMGVDIWGRDLRGADLRGADLRGADLRGADLRDADLRGADLMGADLRGADLYGANGIRAFRAGEYNRLCFTYIHNNEQRYQLGCFNYNYEETVDEIRKKYGDDSQYEIIVTAYKWGIE